MAPGRWAFGTAPRPERTVLATIPPAEGADRQTADS